jgi:uncharacterized protein (TIGR03435 family)
LDRHWQLPQAWQRDMEAPHWIDSERFDIEGEAEDPRADPDQLRLMLRSLFEDRFKLKVHRETKEAPVYA